MLVETIRKFLRDDAGATAIEYALIATLIAIGLLATLTMVGNGLEALFNNGAAETINSQTGKL